MLFINMRERSRHRRGISTYKCDINSFSRRCASFIYYLQLLFLDGLFIALGRSGVVDLLGLFGGFHAGDTDELGLKDESSTAGDGADAAVAVAKLGWNRESSLLANAHVEKTLVPALDDLTSANLEVERGTAIVAGIKLRTVGSKGASIVHRDLVALFGLALALDLVGDVDLELGGGGGGGGSEGRNGGEDGGGLHGCGIGFVEEEEDMRAARDA